MKVLLAGARSRSGYPAGQAYNIVDEEPVRLKDFLSAY